MFLSVKNNEIIQTYPVVLCHQLLSTWSNEVATRSQVVKCNENHCQWLVVVHIRYVEWHLSFAQSLSSVTVKINTYTLSKLNPLLLYIDLCRLWIITWNLQGEEAGQRGWKRWLWVWVSICRNPKRLYEHSLNIFQVSCYHSVELL